METLSDGDPMWYSWGWYSIGIAEMYRDNLKECIKAFENALTYAKKSGNIFLISSIAGRLSPIEARMGLYTSSHKRCSDLITFMNESGYSQIIKSECTYAGVYSTMAGIESDKKITYSDDLGYYPYALLLIIEKKFEEAEILLSRLLKMAQAANRIERIIETKVIYANLKMATGEKEKAIKNLIEALEDAACENILMSFVLYHSGISDLLKEVYKIQATSKTKIPRELIDKLKFALEKREKIMKNNSESVLSDREIDTLKLIAGDLSNQDVADKLFVSLNTVKTHVKNILLKLAVDSRMQAVTKAKELGII